MNNCCFIGRFAADPETKTTAGGITVCNFRLAVQRRYKDASGERQADFISFVAWRQTAEFIARNFHKGDAIAVRGSLQTRSYPAQDGSTRYTSEVIVDDAEFVGSAQQNRAQSVSQTAQQAREVFGGFTEVTDDELPF